MMCEDFMATGCLMVERQHITFQDTKYCSYTLDPSQQAITNLTVPTLTENFTT
jgi:hypothetical protein